MMPWHRLSMGVACSVLIGSCTSWSYLSFCPDFKVSAGVAYLSPSSFLSHYVSHQLHFSLTSFLSNFVSLPLCFSPTSFLSHFLSPHFICYPTSFISNFISLSLRFSFTLFLSHFVSLSLLFSPTFLLSHFISHHFVSFPLVSLPLHFFPLSFSPLHFSPTLFVSQLISHPLRFSPTSFFTHYCFSPTSFLSHFVSPHLLSHPLTLEQGCSNPEKSSLQFSFRDNNTSQSSKLNQLWFHTNWKYWLAQRWIITYKTTELKNKCFILFVVEAAEFSFWRRNAKKKKKKKISSTYAWVRLQSIFLFLHLSLVDVKCRWKRIITT